mgnify:CR=1 FL=1
MPMPTVKTWWPWRWPTWLWLGGLTLALLIRFPIHFLLEPPYLMDFQVYHIVARRVVEGHAALLYAPTTSELMVFKYAPCWALLWAPLAGVSDPVGAVLWSGLSVLCLSLTCLLAIRLCQRIGLSTPPWLCALAALLVVRPLTAEFLNGQVDLLWGLLVVGYLVAEQARRPWWAATALALAVSLKLPALIFIAYGLMRRRWVDTARVLLVGIGLNVPSALLLDPAHPWRIFQAWAQVLWSSGSGRAFEIGNQSLAALLARLLSDDGYRLNLLALDETGVLIATLGVFALLFGLVCVRPASELDEPSRRVVDGALLTTLMVLCSPTVWIATYSALLFPAAAAVAALATPRRRRSGARLVERSTTGAIIILSLLTHGKVWKALGVPAFRSESYVYLVFLILPWLALALFALLLGHRAAIAELHRSAL